MRHLIYESAEKDFRKVYFRTPTGRPGWLTIWRQWNGSVMAEKQMLVSSALLDRGQVKAHGIVTPLTQREFQTVGNLAGG